MIYTYNDFLQYIPDLKRFVKSKIKTDWWKDIIQDTLLYLYLKFDTLIINNIKGILFNTAIFFINKHFNKNKSIEYTDVLETKFMYKVYNQPIFKIGDWNSYKINDKLYHNLRTISKTLLIPFEMQMDFKSVKEIAIALDLNENTVKTRIKRAKEYLKIGI